MGARNAIDDGGKRADHDFLPFAVGHISNGQDDAGGGWQGEPFGKGFERGSPQNAESLVIRSIRNHDGVPRSDSAGLHECSGVVADTNDSVGARVSRAHESLQEAGSNPELASMPDGNPRKAINAGKNIG